MLVLSVVWLAGGALVGALAHAAALGPAHAARRALMRALATGAVAALAGGWLGTVVWGRFFGSPTAAWVAVLAAVALPWLGALMPARGLRIPGAQTRT